MKIETSFNDEKSELIWNAAVEAAVWRFIDLQQNCIVMMTSTAGEILFSCSSFLSALNK